MLTSNDDRPLMLNQNSDPKIPGLNLNSANQSNDQKLEVWPTSGERDNSSARSALDTARHRDETPTNIPVHNPSLHAIQHRSTVKRTLSKDLPVKK